MVCHCGLAAVVTEELRVLVGVLVGPRPLSALMHDSRLGVALVQYLLGHLLLFECLKVVQAVVLGVVPCLSFLG